jgi:hypothetical protein
MTRGTFVAKWVARVLPWRRGTGWELKSLLIFLPKLIINYIIRISTNVRRQYLPSSCRMLLQAVGRLDVSGC